MIRVVVKTVVTDLVPDQDENKEGAGQAYHKTGKVDDGIEPVPGKISESQ
jgi:hypothetical protein